MKFLVILLLCVIHYTAETTACTPYSARVCEKVSECEFEFMLENIIQIEGDKIKILKIKENYG